MAMTMRAGPTLPYRSYAGITSTDGDTLVTSQPPYFSNVMCPFVGKKVEHSLIHGE